MLRVGVSYFIFARMDSTWLSFVRADPMLTLLHKGYSQCTFTQCTLTKVHCVNNCFIVWNMHGVVFKTSVHTFSVCL